jgi:hypothetical protein
MPVEYISLEDGGDATRAVQNIKKLVQENNIDALIGPSTTPNAFAILDVIAEAKVPMMATVGTSAVVEPIDAKKRWVFKTTQNDDLIAAALLKHMAKYNVKTVAFIGFSDPYGDNWLKVFGSLGEKSRHQSRQCRTFQSHRSKRDRTNAADARGEAGCDADRRGRRTGRIARSHAARPGMEGPRFIKRTQWRPMISSNSAKTRSRARCWLPARCW